MPIDYFFQFILMHKHVHNYLHVTLQFVLINTSTFTNQN